MRHYIYNFLEQNNSSTLARLVNLLLMLLIMFNVMAVILASDSVIYTQLQVFFDSFELFSIIIFSMEYLFRTWVCVEDPRYQQSVKEPLNKSGSNRLSVKIFWFKAWNARNSRAIAKFHNAETGHFNRKMSIHDLIRGSLRGV